MVGLMGSLVAEFNMALQIILLQKRLFFLKLKIMQRVGGEG
jgi:hypothetical protein